MKMTNISALFSTKAWIEREVPDFLAVRLNTWMKLHFRTPKQPAHTVKRWKVKMGRKMRNFHTRLARKK